MPLSNTSQEHVPRDMCGFPSSSWRVSKYNRLLLIYLAYYKMAESLGPEWQSDDGHLVLYVQPNPIGITADTSSSNGDTHGFTFHADWINGEPLVPVPADRQAGPVECWSMHTNNALMLSRVISMTVPS